MQLLKMALIAGLLGLCVVHRGGFESRSRFWGATGLSFVRPIRWGTN